MQAKIIKLLMDCDRNSKQISIVLNTTSGSVGKQLSQLMSLGAVRVVSERRPKTYGLTEKFKTDLKKGF